MAITEGESEMKRLFVCNKAGINTYCSSCIYSELNEFKNDNKQCPYADYGIEIIRYRHPLEVAIVNSIKAYRHNMRISKKYGTNWFEYQHVASALWRVLKEGRK